jgi:hypothetical protein
MASMVKRIGRDRYRIRLGSEEIALLRGLPDQLRSVLAGAETKSEGSWELLRDDLRNPGSSAEAAKPAAGGGEEGRAGPPGGEEAAGGDPVLDRLFPQAYLDAEDAERDAEFQRLVRNDLLKEKLANLDVVAGTLERGTVSLRRWSVEITEEEAGAWLGALNDLRLALGVRLGITEDFDGDIDPSDPRAPALHVLSYLGWLEENLVEALSSGW